MRTLRRFLWRFLKILLALIIVVLTPVASAGVLLGTTLFLPLPAHLPKAPPVNTSEISRVYDINGNQLAIFRQFETSIRVKQEDIPTVLKQAVIAAEDRNFYEHSGVDIRGTTRALWADIRNRAAVQGGSTITQQLVKLTYTGGERSVSRKIREAVLASQLDRQTDKDDILFEYLSIIYLGEGAYGVGAAAETYFRKSVRDLDLSESALLAGLIPAPSRYSPRVNGLQAEAKRRHVLGAMLEEGMISKRAYDEAYARTIWDIQVGLPAGPATIFYPPENTQSTEPFFTDYVLRYLTTRLPGGRDQIFKGGLRIETSLDPALQAAAKGEVGGFLDGTDPDLQMSLVSIEPPTGFVRAFVGGRDWNASQVNFALGRAGGGSGRQTGSSFKPFVLAEAFEQGITPESTWSGAPHTVGNFTVHNYGGSRYGTLTLRNATWSSVNAVYTRLIERVGVEEAMDMARRLGLTSLPAFDPAKYGVSVALGAVDTSPLEMASAYSVFANHGARQEPTPVLRVFDRDGKLILDNTERKAKQVVTAEVADNVTSVLEGVLISGTARGRGLDRPAAGKTGTTQDNKDSWFAGYTPTLSTAVWLGYENKPGTPTRYLRNIKGVGAVTGGTHPARIWQAFMKKALEGVPVTEFTEPAPIREIADDAKRKARGYFDPGDRMYARGSGAGGPYRYDPDPPAVDLPVASTTSTTSTTVKEEDTTTSSSTDITLVE
jgi:penicillin-binding protein 1A